MKRYQPQFDQGDFPYYRANQKPGLSPGCRMTAVVLSVIILFLIGLVLANADVIDNW